MKRNLLFRKLSVITLALGLTVGVIPGVTAASSHPQFKLPNLQRSTSLATELSFEPIISPKIDTNSTKKIRVIVQLDGQPTAVGKYASRMGMRSASAFSETAVQNEQNEFLNEVKDQKLDLQVNYTYNTVLNGFEVTIPANEITDLAAIPGVKSIQKNSTWYALPIEPSADENYEINPLKQIGADQAWAKGLTGEGLKVGVIDTGIDYNHPDIKDAYVGGYDSFYQDNDPSEEPPLTIEEDIKYKVGFEGTYHGTHVAGTIIGRASKTESDIVQKGVAPDAKLYAYKVLGRDVERPDISTGTSAQVIDGIERAVKDGMDVINLSLGSDSEKNVNSPDSVAINNAVLSGVVAVVANGNAGPDYSTMGSPAGAQLAIAVGAVTSESTHYSGKLLPNLVNNTSVTTVTYDSYGDFNLMGWETSQTDFVNILGTTPLDVVYVGLGDTTDYTGKDVTGKVVLVSRGKLAFVDKISIAKDHGAKAIVIFNGRADGSAADLSGSIANLDGHINVDLSNSFDYLPTFDLKGIEGRSLARALMENPDQTLQFTFPTSYPSEIVPGDTLADFSSWGPNADQNMSIKPDFTAPGVNILSTFPGFDSNSYEQAYQRLSGTSMAAPHVAGLALLLLQQHPDWTPFDIRAALANTADVLTDPDDYLYDVYQQGAGRVDVGEAILTPALLQSVEPITILDKNYNSINVINYNSSANFGVVAPGSGKQEKELLLKNTSSNDVAYTAEIEWHQDHEGIEATLDNSTISATGDQATSFHLNLDVTTDADENFYEGQINLESPGLPTLHLPFVIYVGSEQPSNGFGIQEVQLTNSIVYPNRSVQNTTNLTFKLTAEDTNYIEINVVDLNDEVIGFFYIASTDDINGRFEPGVYALNGISGSYQPYSELDEPTIAHLKDGTYKINIFAAQLNNSGQIVKDGARPIQYEAYTSYRINNSVSSGGNSGGGNSGGGSSITTPTPTSSPATTVNAATNAIIEQGFKQLPIVAKTSSVSGVTIATISDNDLKAALTSAASSPAAIIIDLPSNSNVETSKLSLTAEQIKLLQTFDPQSTIVFSFAGSAVSFPVSLLTKAPASNNLEIVISKSKDLKSHFDGKTLGGTLIGEPVSFEANWVSTSGSQPIEVPNHTFIKRSFSVPGNIEPNTAGVLYEENGKVRPVSSLFKTQTDGTTLVVVNRPGFSVYAAASRTINFNDIASSWAASDITALAKKFIIEGTSATTFSPQANLTRAEFTSLLVRSLGLQGTANTQFTDIKASDWFTSDVAAAYEAGLIQGTGNNKFSPNAKVTRQELTVILARALKLTGVQLKASIPSFTAYADEAKIAGYAKESVNTLSAAGLISGETVDGGSYFRPDTATTRETVAAALHQLLRSAKLID
ncbi:subtilisin family serine protease [Paenibacillus anaericanus]|uniref:S8 family serine peptidase n=1 Tax=Paenibacillus anaericanus TaxID=170367 RepID=UPI00278976C1|nr:S8 family serine peptidase [Paenibacillus anaericanus]MDQ0090736.1 subtilisin family serine protease [Paenibacillus anaericanus]